jgi:hypothetical protein
MPVIGGFLTTREVAALEGVKTTEVTAWCRRGELFPAQLVCKSWRISPDYILIPGAKIGPPPGERGKGRPRGSRNKNPYPVGVKRPRKSAA